MVYLDCTLVQQLLEPLGELLVLRGGGIPQETEDLRRKSRDFIVDEPRDCGERVANPEAAVADQPDDVAGVGILNRVAALPEELLGI